MHDMSSFFTMAVTRCHFIVMGSFLLTIANIAKLFMLFILTMEVFPLLLLLGIMAAKVLLWHFTNNASVTIIILLIVGMCAHIQNDMPGIILSY